MLNSGDSLLISLFIVLTPAIGILIGTILYSMRLVNRYTKAIARLYRASFKGVDYERKRIARDLHDHLGAHAVLMSERFEEAKAHLSGESLSKVQDIESSFAQFRAETHRMVEYMYPKGLVSPNWHESFSLLSQQLTTKDHSVEFEFIGERTPSSEKLHHTYWSVQEIVINAIKHSKAAGIQIAAVSEDKFLTISITYKATDQGTSWLRSKKQNPESYGTLIINDRLDIINAGQDSIVENGCITHLITIPYEDSDS